MILLIQKKLILQGSYVVEDSATDPDPYIGILNQDLTMIEETITLSLTPNRSK